MRSLARNFRLDPEHVAEPLGSQCFAHAPVCDDPATSKRLSTDGHYNRLCHVLGGSAFIDMPLSTYRIHGDNAHVSEPSLHAMLTDGGPATRWW